jgi:hypothetical protein
METMKTEIEAAGLPPVDWRRLHALGLPAGSIRALLALIVFGTALGLLALRPTQEVPDYLRDLLFIIMGHYFASRHRVGQDVEPGPSPLYLPRGSIRFLLIAGTIAVSVLLYSRGQLTSPGQHPGVVTLWLVGGFLLGVALNAMSGWCLGRDRRPPRIIEDVRAFVSLAAALILVLMVWNRLYLVVPPEQIDQALSPWFHLGKFRLEHALAAVVGFYFGSRS